MKVYRKRMEDIRKGEVVAGELNGWWRVVSRDVDKTSRTVVLKVTAVEDPSKRGTLYGNFRDWRDCASGI